MLYNKRQANVVKKAVGLMATKRPFTNEPLDKQVVKKQWDKRYITNVIHLVLFQRVTRDLQSDSILRKFALFT